MTSRWRREIDDRCVWRHTEPDSAVGQDTCTVPKGQRSKTRLEWGHSSPIIDIIKPRYCHDRVLSVKPCSKVAIWDVRPRPRKTRRLTTTEFAQRDDTSSLAEKFFYVHMKLLLHFAWVVDDAKCIVVMHVCVSLSVCLSVCLCVSAAACPHYCTDPDVTWRSGRHAP